MRRKKLLPFAIALTSVMLFVACGTSDTSKSASSATTTSAVTTETDKESMNTVETASTSTTSGTTVTKAVNGVTKLSLYVCSPSYVREKTTEYKSTWVQGKDIVSFEAFATDTNSFTFGGKYFDAVFNDYWNAYSNSANCKIGYTVSFTLKNGEKVEKTLKSPADVTSIYDYVQCWLYDDVNQIQGQWYSHITAGEVTSKTILTSIKFTAGDKISDVDGKISLTGFVYDSEDDFDKKGSYIGNVSFTATVINQ